MKLTDSVLNKLRKRAAYVAKKSGLNEEDIQEFVQDYSLMLVEKGWRQTPDQAFVDYTRKRFGRTRERGDIARKVIPITFTDLDAARGEDASERLVDDDSKYGGRLVAIETIINGAKGNDRIVMLLSAKWGFSHADIGEVLGVSESRISQMYHKAVRAQKARNKKEAARENERKGQQKESGQIPSKIQNRSEIQGEDARQLESLFSENGKRVGFFEIKKIPEEICRPFGVAAF